jgi:protoporphyrinogen oxidase
MDIAIIGGGITGLSAAYKLTRAGHTVTIFEREQYLGGLAYGFRESNWRWFIEGAYHHLFTNDSSIIGLIRELGISDSLLVKRPLTASLWHDAMYQLDSPLSLLKFPGLSTVDKIRTAILLGILKFTPFWRPLESITAEHLIISIGGKNAWNTIWKPLLYGKFGTLAPTVSAAWFWARIKKRTPSLCYIRGGFHTVIHALETTIKSQGGAIHTNTAVSSVRSSTSDKYTLTWAKASADFDRILITVPSPIALKLLPELPQSYTNPLVSIPHLHAQTLILETDKPILKDVYWLNVTDTKFPFLAAVAHTNFMKKEDYGGHHITYFGNYLPQGHPYLSMTKKQLLTTFTPYIKRLTHTKYSIINSFTFTGLFAQPVHQQRYSIKAPKLLTPLPHVYLANMDSIYPWDRGTNYAVELGLNAATHILNEH